MNPPRPAPPRLIPRWGRVILRAMSEYKMAKMAVLMVSRSRGTSRKAVETERRVKVERIKPA